MNIAPIIAANCAAATAAISAANTSRGVYRDYSYGDSDSTLWLTFWQALGLVGVVILVIGGLTAALMVAMGEPL